jgi:hypothetical protein
MAENEILDIRGRRWRETRRLLSMPATSCSEVAKCAVAELEAGIRLDLNATLKHGQPLFDLLRAADGPPGGLREVALGFKKRALAGVVRKAIEDCGSPLTTTRVAERTAELLVAKTRDKILGFAFSTPEYSDENRRNALRVDVTERFRSAQDSISEYLESALEGLKLRSAKISRIPRRPAEEQLADVMSRSLLPKGIPRHGSRRR